MDSVLECLPRGSRVADPPASVPGRLRPHHTRARHSQALPPDLHIAIVVEDRFREIFEGNPDLDEILAPELAALRRFRPHLCLNLARRHAQRLDDGALRRTLSRRLRALPPAVRLQRERSRARRKFWASTAKSTPPNIWPRAIFFLGAPACRDSAREACSCRSRPPSTPNPDRRHPPRRRHSRKDLARRQLPGRRRASGSKAATRPRLHRRTRRRPLALPPLPHPARRAALRTQIAARLAPPSSSAMIPAPPIWRPLSACPSSSSSAPAIPKSGGRGAPQAKSSRAGWHRRIAVSQVLDALQRAAGARMKQLLRLHRLRPQVLAADSALRLPDGSRRRRAGHHAAAHSADLRSRPRSQLPDGPIPLLPHPFFDHQSI